MARFTFLPDAMPISFEGDSVLAGESGFVVAKVTEGDHLGDYVVRLDSTGEHIFIPDEVESRLVKNRNN